MARIAQVGEKSGPYSQGNRARSPKENNGRKEAYVHSLECRAGHLPARQGERLGTEAAEAAAAVPRAP